MPNILLSCGCRANSTDGDGNPSCAIHAGLGIDIYPVAEPNLEGRKALCSYCNIEMSSSLSLWFFEYRGAGSPNAIHKCKNCGCYSSAHTEEKRRKNKYICNNFEAHGPYDFDLFYCGCRGYD